MISTQSVRELAAEFLGTFVLMLFGLGVNAQVTLGAASDPDFLASFSRSISAGDSP